MCIRDRFELQANEGPCVDCFESGEPIVNVELSGFDKRWPAFAQRAVDDGFHSVHALPLHLRGQTVGALNMFRRSRGSLDAEALEAAQALADAVSYTHLDVYKRQAYGRSPPGESL